MTEAVVVLALMISLGIIDYDSNGGHTVHFTGQHRTFIKDIPTTQSELFEGLIFSANQNKYVKMNGGIDFM